MICFPFLYLLLNVSISLHLSIKLCVVTEVLPRKDINLISQCLYEMRNMLLLVFQMGQRCPLVPCLVNLNLFF